MHMTLTQARSAVLAFRHAAEAGHSVAALQVLQNNSHYDRANDTATDSNAAISALNGPEGSGHVPSAELLAAQVRMFMTISTYGQTMYV